MLNEFKAFIARGNVVDLAVGIIIGASFTAIVNSLVADLVNPLIGVVTKDFLVQMNHDGSNPSMHDLASPEPLQNVAQEHPEEYQRLLDLGRGLYEAARFMLTDNVRE